MKSVTLGLPVLVCTALLWSIANPGRAESSFMIPELRVTQSEDDAEAACLEAARERGWQGADVVSTSAFAGGQEVILQVRQQDDRVRMGCDYADATGQTDLYWLDDQSNDSLDNSFDRRTGNDQFGRSNDRSNDRSSDDFDQSFEDIFER